LFEIDFACGREDPFVIAYSPATKNMKVHQLKSGEKIDDIGFLLSLIDSRVYVAGLYSLKNEAGYKLYSIDPSNLTISLVTSNKIPKSYYDVMNAGAYKPELYKVYGIHELRNGNLILDISCSFGSDLNHYTPSVYIVCVNPSGTEQWSTIIQKFQVQPLSGFMLEHVLIVKGDKAYLLYNDDIDNFDVSPTARSREGLIKKNIYIAVVEIDEIGSAKKIPTFSKSKDDKLHFFPSLVVRVEENLYQLNVVKDGKVYLATMAFD
jgi:hypothetical protein